MKETTGAEALALAAIDSGVAYAAGYPGAPATAVMNAVMQAANPKTVYLEWAANEKVAVESALGASMAGARSLVILKSVGMNACVDPLMVANLAGIGAGMVVLLGDDPGAEKSQNDQDTRPLVIYEELPLLEPGTVHDGYRAVQFAFELSDDLHVPVVVRFTNPFAKLVDNVERARNSEKHESGEALLPEGRWISTTHNVLENHRRLHARLAEAEGRFEASALNEARGDGQSAVVAAGATYRFVQDASGRALRVVKLATLFPLPAEALQRALEGAQQVLVLEENEPVIEGRLAAAMHRMNHSVRVKGRLTGDLPREGELGRDIVDEALRQLASPEMPASPALPERSEPSLRGFCDGCPYVPAFETFLSAVKRAGVHGRVVTAGDPGCMVKGVYPPFEVFNIKLCMGSSIAVVAGAVRANPALLGVAFTGDSSLFHSGVNALLSVAASDVSMVVVIVDNGATALTGCQPHPGTEFDAWGRPRQSVRIEDLIRACRPVFSRIVDPADRAETERTFAEALQATGLRLIVLRRPCPLISRSPLRI